MTDKIKGDIEKIKTDIAPYLHKQFLKKPYVEAVDVTPICQLIRRKYKQVIVAPKPGEDGKPYLKIKVERFLLGGELSYEIRIKGKSVHTHNAQDSLEWIDWMEDWHAMMDD